MAMAPIRWPLGATIQTVQQRSFGTEFNSNLLLQTMERGNYLISLFSPVLIGQRRAAQQYHVLYLELLAVCDDGTLVRVAHSESAPLVVRGRAPGHYAAVNKEPIDSNESGFPYNCNPSDPNYYNQMMQAGYYYQSYYSNSALWASATGSTSIPNPASPSNQNQYYSMSAEHLGM
jgi:hypothetical protein